MDAVVDQIHPGPLFAELETLQCDLERPFGRGQRFLQTHDRPRQSLRLGGRRVRFRSQLIPPELDVVGAIAELLGRLVLRLVRPRAGVEAERGGVGADQLGLAADEVGGQALGVRGGQPLGRRQTDRRAAVRSRETGQQRRVVALEADGRRRPRRGARAVTGLL